MSKTTAIIQARMTSNRLPGKVLQDLCGKPMLGRILERVARAQAVDQILVATSVGQEDDPVAELGEEYGVQVFRGSLDDVLGRFYQAAKNAGADPVVRLTADCPLADPELIDQHVKAYRDARGQLDYVTNVLTPTFPDGLDLSVFSFKVLESAAREADLVSEREHVVPWIWKNTDLRGGRRYRALNLVAESDYSAMRWTVDRPADLEFIRTVYAHFIDKGQMDFGWKDVISFLKQRPELELVNQNIVRDEGYLRSLEKDRKVLK